MADGDPVGNGVEFIDRSLSGPMGQWRQQFRQFDPS